MCMFDSCMCLGVCASLVVWSLTLLLDDTVSDSLLALVLAWGTGCSPVELTLYPTRGVRRALSPRRVPSARPLRLAPRASGVAPGLIRTARARATIVQESAKCENTDFCNSWRPFLALERSSEKAFKNAKHGSQLLRSSS